MNKKVIIFKAWDSESCEVTVMNNPFEGDIYGSCIRLNEWLLSKESEFTKKLSKVFYDGFDWKKASPEEFKERIDLFDKILHCGPTKCQLEVAIQMYGKENFGYEVILLPQ